ESRQFTPDRASHLFRAGWRHAALVPSGLCGYSYCMRLACFRQLVWPAIAAGYTPVLRNPQSVSRKRIAVKYAVTLLLSCGLVFGSEKANAHAVREFHNQANELIQRALSFVPD